MDFKKFMKEEHTINRWAISAVFLTGMFCGAVLGIFVALHGII
jgi:hypothetical protein